MIFLKLKILIVDDDLHFTGFLKEHLEKDLNVVLTATNKAEALSIIQTQKSLKLPIDLVLVDYVLPNDDGIDISNAIKELDPTLFQIALTEHDAPEITKKLIYEGAFTQIISKFDTSDTIDNMLSVMYSSKKQRQAAGAGILPDSEAK